MFGRMRRKGWRYEQTRTASMPMLRSASDRDVRERASGNLREHPLLVRNPDETVSRNREGSREDGVFRVERENELIMHDKEVQIDT